MNNIFSKVHKITTEIETFLIEQVNDAIDHLINGKANYSDVLNKKTRIPTGWHSQKKRLIQNMFKLCEVSNLSLQQG
jgi:uncharacterized protein YutD